MRGSSPESNRLPTGAPSVNRRAGARSDFMIGRDSVNLLILVTRASEKRREGYAPPVPNT
jgi:hypothetical protein